MRRNRKNSIKKERIIMITSSVFVLAALTMTGVYLKDLSTKSNDEEYSIDFTELESVDPHNLAKEENPIIQEESLLQNDQFADNSMLNNDLDYLPMEEAGSGLVEIPGLTDQIQDDEQLADIMEQDAALDNLELALDEQAEEKKETKNVATQNVTVGKELHFSQEQSLLKPVAGEVLMHYNMDSSVYFATLDQYKYNPAVIISATEGDTVVACAEGKVINIFENEEIGKAVTLDLGDGYQATYGQLSNISVKLDSFVGQGTTIGTVAAPTIYYSVEGSNIYFKLTHDGTPINPENQFQ